MSVTDELYHSTLKRAVEAETKIVQARYKINYELDRGYKLWRALVISCILIGVGLMFVVHAYAHDADMATSPTQAEVFKQYSKWMRPKGNFAGVEHRKISCCNKTDCGVVRESRRVNGRLEVRVCTEDMVCDPNSWYPVDPSIDEANQPDPEPEFADGRTHACVIGGVVACYNAGAGM